VDIRGKTYRIELIVSNFIENFIGIALTGTTVWGNDREGSLRSLSYQWLVPFRSCCHLMAYRTSRVWYPACVPAKHVGLAYHHKKRKNRPGLLLRRLVSIFSLPLYGSAVLGYPV